MSTADAVTIMIARDYYSKPLSVTSSYLQDAIGQGGNAKNLLLWVYEQYGVKSLPFTMEAWVSGQTYLQLALMNEGDIHAYDTIA